MAKLKRGVVLSEDAGTFLNQMNNETDRGAALVAMAYLDQLLRQLFEAKLRAGALAKNLLEYPGALSTMAARRDVAYCLGWIGPKMYADLKKLGTIRNLFAHRFEPLAFSDSKVKKLCGQLNTIDLLFPINSGYEPEARKNFSITAMFIATLLDGYKRGGRGLQGKCDG